MPMEDPTGIGVLFGIIATLAVVIGTLLSMALPVIFIVVVLRSLTAMAKPGGPLHLTREMIARQGQGGQGPTAHENAPVPGLSPSSNDRTSLDGASTALPRLPQQPASGRPEAHGSSLIDGDGFLARYQAANVTGERQARLRRLIPLLVVGALFLLAYLLTNAAS